jgi:hypothetical protein
VVPLVFKTSLGAVRFPEGSTPSLLRQYLDRALQVEIEETKRCLCGRLIWMGMAKWVTSGKKDCALEPGECSNKSLSNYFREHRLHDLPSLFLDEFQMFLTAHAFCVNFA